MKDGPVLLLVLGDQRDARKGRAEAEAFGMGSPVGDDGSVGLDDLRTQRVTRHRCPVKSSQNF